jgi:hypothetical protein
MIPNLNSDLGAFENQLVRQVKAILITLPLAWPLEVIQPLVGYTEFFEITGQLGKQARCSP